MNSIQKHTIKQLLKRITNLTWDYVLSPKRTAPMRKLFKHFRIQQKLEARLPPSLYPEAHTVYMDNKETIKIAYPFQSYVGRQVVATGDLLEPETVQLFYHLLKESRLFLDIGANFGLYTLAARYYNAAANIISFEPQARIFSLLKQSVALNGWFDIVLEQIALSDFDGENNPPYTETLRF